MKEMVGGCCVCSDERGWPDNPLVYCDGNGCTVAVHQACYGIVTVPTGPWYCRKCESPDTKGKVKCDLCPSKSGALKRSDTGGWAHVVCALYIPEVRFGNVTSMEPIVLRLIPQERYNKSCYICQDSGKSSRASAGACMQCNKSGCKQQFHVTCAQSLGLLCEEAGNYLDNVKYCGYCQHHYSKLKKGGNVKPIPPYKPVSHDGHSSDSSGDKDGGGSPMTGGGATPTHGSKKGSGKKSSHSSGTSSGKNTPNPSKTPTNTSQPMGGKLHHYSSEKGKKPSPSRRISSASDAPSAGTPTPSPQHTANSDGVQDLNKPSTMSSSPSSKVMQESIGVISSVASAAAAIVSSASTPPASTSMVTSVVQATSAAKTMAAYQESVITNAELIDSKQTKKRKAMTASNSANSDYVPPPLPPHSGGNMWESAHHAPPDAQMENIEKIVKKAKTEPADHSMGAPSTIPIPPPPPAHSPRQPSPRHLPSANVLPGPSGVGPASNIRSPSQLQGKAGADRESTTSLLVSVPLPSTSQGLNLSAHAQLPGPPSDNAGASLNIFHQAQKSALIDDFNDAYGGQRNWGGLNVSYEKQQPDANKPSGSGLSNSCKEPVASGSGTNTTIRNKKRAAMNAANTMATPPTIQAAPPPGPTKIRRPPVAAPPPPPPPIYQETKESPPSSPSSERPLKPKSDSKIGPSYTAPHMLGNELNPDSGAAARLQEQLSAELAAHAVAGVAPPPLLPPPLINKATQGPSSTRSSTSSAQSLDQLLERQWEQGSQFLMEQAQHFDIASLLSCLHQLRTENVRLEEHVGNLLQRRDHLLAVNARLAIPLATAVPPGPPDQGRCSRENGSQGRAPSGPVRNETITSQSAHQMMDPAYVQMMMRDVQPKPS